MRKDKIKEKPHHKSPGRNDKKKGVLSLGHRFLPGVARCFFFWFKEGDLNMVLSERGAWGGGERGDSRSKMSGIQNNLT